MTFEDGIQLASAILMIVFALVAIGVVVVAIRRGVAERESEDARRRAAAQVAATAAAEGHVEWSAEARPGVCVVCGGQATKPLVVFGTSLLDRVNVLARLFAQIPKYVVADHPSETPYLCVTHHRIAVGRSEQKLAEVRHRSAEFHAQVAGELSTWEGGGMLAYMRLEHRRSVESLAAAVSSAESMPALPPAQRATVTIPPSEGS